MSSCCVSGCKNRHSSGSKLRFYRIPSGKGPFRKNRRRLWLQAIQQVNGSTEGLKGNVRVCGAHFISGEASMDHDNPDFVPSVFECAYPSPKKKMKWVPGCRKKWHHKANMKEREETSPGGDSPLEDQPALLVEGPQTQSSSSLQKEEALTELDETENESQTIESETTSSPIKDSTSFKVPANIPDLGKMIPTVLLKSVFAPAGGYQCEQCSQIFLTASQLVKHRQVHEGERPCVSEVSGELSTSQADLMEFEDVQEPSFNCNICDRSFTTSQNLKRHKLLHVKDGRKCHKCGALFCQLHNHVLYLPQVKSEEESPVVETVLVKTEQNQLSDFKVDAQSTMTVTQMQTAKPPKLEVRNPLPPASHTRIITKIPVPTLKIASKQLAAHRNAKKVHPPCFIQPHLPQNLELPPRLKVFSPKHLTSALLRVERDYDYILEKARKFSNDLVIGKTEPHELPLVSPVEQDKKELIAYDLEVMI